MRLFLLLVFTAWARLGAVIVSGGDGTQNGTGAGAGEGWNYVGIGLGQATAIYLGQYGGAFWVITAAHVGAADFLLDDIVYPLVAGSAQTLPGVDLQVYQIDGNPGLANLPLSSIAPAVGSEIIMIGSGPNREPPLYYFNTLTNPWTYSTLPPGIRQGYLWGSGNAMRWGNNVISGSEIINDGFGTFASLYTTFNEIDDEGQAGSGDSGGGFFFDNAGTWELAGLMVTISTFDNQTPGSAVFGNRTYAVDISMYRNAILAAVPEPSAGALAGLGLAVALAVRRIRLRCPASCGFDRT